MIHSKSLSNKPTVTDKTAIEITDYLFNMYIHYIEDLNKDYYILPEYFELLSNRANIVQTYLKEYGYTLVFKLPDHTIRFEKC